MIGGITPSWLVLTEFPNARSSKYGLCEYLIIECLFFLFFSFKLVYMFASRNAAIILLHYFPQEQSVNLFYKYKILKLILKKYYRWKDYLCVLTTIARNISLQPQSEIICLFFIILWDFSFRLLFSYLLYSIHEAHYQVINCQPYQSTSAAILSVLPSPVTRKSNTGNF